MSATFTTRRALPRAISGALITGDRTSRPAPGPAGATRQLLPPLQTRLFQPACVRVSSALCHVAWLACQWLCCRCPFPFARLAYPDSLPNELCVGSCPFFVLAPSW